MWPLLTASLFGLPPHARRKPRGKRRVPSGMHVTSGIPVVKSPNATTTETGPPVESEHVWVEFSVVCPPKSPNEAMVDGPVVGSLLASLAYFFFFSLSVLGADVLLKCNSLRVLLRFFSSWQRWTAASSVGGHGRRSRYASRRRSCRWAGEGGTTPSPSASPSESHKVSDWCNTVCLRRIKITHQNVWFYKNTEKGCFALRHLRSVLCPTPPSGTRRQLRSRVQRRKKWVFLFIYRPCLCL